MLILGIVGLALVMLCVSGFLMTAGVGVISEGWERYYRSEWPSIFFGAFLTVVGAACLVSIPLVVEAILREAS